MDGGPSPESIPSLVSRLVGEGKEFARAEVNLVRARIAPRVAEGRNALILAVIALSLVQALLVTALVGVVLALSWSLGAGWATIVVVAAGLVLVALLGWAAFVQAKKAFGSNSEGSA